MNVYYSGWGFVIKRKSVVNGELIEYIDDELPNWYREQIHEAQVYDVTKIRDYFRLPSEESTELTNMGSVSISYLFNDDVS